MQFWVVRELRERKGKALSLNLAPGLWVVTTDALGIPALSAVSGPGLRVNVRIRGSGLDVDHMCIGAKFIWGQTATFGIHQYAQTLHIIRGQTSQVFSICGA